MHNIEGLRLKVAYIGKNTGLKAKNSKNAYMHSTTHNSNTNNIAHSNTLLCRCIFRPGARSPFCPNFRKNNKILISANSLAKLRKLVVSPNSYRISHISCHSHTCIHFLLSTSTHSIFGMQTALNAACAALQSVQIQTRNCFALR